MKQFELFIGQIMRIGLYLSIFVVLIGGILYLSKNGNAIIQDQTFHNEPVALTSVLGILSSTFYYPARGLIQFGILLLIFTQILRVAFTACLFMLERDLLFSIISLFIFVVLLYSLLWQP